MACYKPVTAYLPLDGGRLTFHEGKESRTIQIPCGICIGCRIDRQQEWAVRIFAEARMHKRNAFITLTYADEHLPMHGNLVYRDYQLFMKRLRKAKKTRVRFFVAGEYGDKFARPHWHAVLFGCHFDDMRQSNSVYSKRPLYQSSELDELWGKGNGTIGEVSYASAQYVASYCLKQHRPMGADDPHYKSVDHRTGEIVDLEPEFAKMSLKPGIGLPWLIKYHADLYASGEAGVFMINDRRLRIPTYFDEKYAEMNGKQFEEVRSSRHKLVDEKRWNCTPERLAVREQCAQARKKHYEEQRR